jgi:hypothetical protein
MKTSTLVEQLLARYPNCRDSDKDLIIGMLQARGANFTPKQLQLIRSVSFESVTRCRRKLQEQGKYMPSSSVQKQRKLKSLMVQQLAPTARPDQLQTVIDTSA